QVPAGARAGVREHGRLRRGERRLTPLATGPGGRARPVPTPVAAPGGRTELAAAGRGPDPAGALYPRGAGAWRLPDAGHGARNQPRRPVAAPLRRLPGPARAPRPLRQRGRLPDGTPGRLTASPLPPAPLPEAGRGEQERSCSPLLRFGGEGSGVR